MTNLFVGDEGTDITLDCGANVTTATMMQIVARTPSGKKKTWNATISGTSKIKYTLATGDLDEIGTWVFQAYIEMPGWKGHGTESSCVVKNHL